MRAPAFVRSGAVAVAVAGAPGAPVSRGARLRAQVRDDRRLRGSLADRARQILRPEDEGPRLGGGGQQASRRLRRRQDGCAALRRHQRACSAELGASHTHHYTTRRDRLLRARRHLLLSAAPRHPQALRRRQGALFRHRHVHEGRSTARPSSPPCSRTAGGHAPGFCSATRSSPPTTRRSQPIGSFRNKTGKKVTLKVRREANGAAERRDGRAAMDRARRDVRGGAARQRAHHRGATASASAMCASGRTPATNTRQQLEEVLSEGKLKDADALVWDLRDGWGGAHPRYLSVFNTVRADAGAHRAQRHDQPRRLSLGEARRHARQRRHALRQGSAGLRLQEERLRPGDRRAHRRRAARRHGVPVVGRQPADHGRGGCCRRRRARRGRRRCPSIEVPFDVRYAAGKDPQLDKAIAVLADGA